MIGSAIIVFREVFEISIILSIILAATNNIPKRKIFILGGIVTGIIGSLIIAYTMSHFGEIFSQIGQEVVNIISLLLAVLLISWTVIWMSSNAKLFSEKLQKASKEADFGLRPLYVISIIIASAILREGSEIILFLMGIYVSSGDIENIIQGSLLGLLLGGVMGFLIYKGLLKFSYKHIFKVTSGLLIFLAASMASEMANFLSAANILTFYSKPLWYSSHILSEDSILGKILHVLLGYDSKPTGLQIIFYSFTIAFIYFNLSIVKAKKQSKV